MLNFSRSSLAILLAVTGSVGADVYYVSVMGADADAGTRDKSWATLAHAAGQAKPGDTIKLLSGVYLQNAHIRGCRGTAEAPITFEAEGEVLIDGSVSPKQWRNEGGGIYSTANIGSRPYAAWVNGRMLLGPSVQPSFKKVLGDPTNLKRGQCNTTPQRTFIRLLDDGDPNLAPVRLAAGHCIVLDDTHHTIWRGVNTGWGLNGYKLQRGSSQNLIADAEIHHVTQGILENRETDRFPPCQFNTFQRLRIHHIGPTKYDHGIYTSGVRTRILNCRFDQITGAPIHAYPAAIDGEYSGNHMSDPALRWIPEDFTGAATAEPTHYYTAMIVWGRGGHRVANNVIHGRFGSGIGVNAVGNWIVNNTIVLTHGGLGLHQNENPSGNRILNNIFHTTGWYVSDDPLLLDHNLYFGGRGWRIGGAEFSSLDELRQQRKFESAGLVADPQLDTDLRPFEASLALEAGTHMGAPGADFDDVPRPQGSRIDIGAFERR